MPDTRGPGTSSETPPPDGDLCGVHGTGMDIVICPRLSFSSWEDTMATVCTIIRLARDTRLKISIKERICRIVIAVMIDFTDVCLALCLVNIL